MLKFIGKIPEHYFVAVSGGSDSMALLDFTLNSKYTPQVVFFNHGTPYSQECQEFIKAHCQEKKLDLIIGHIERPKLKDESLEEYWRNERISFFKKLQNPVLTGHNLNDAVETYLFNCINGKDFTIPYQNENIFRPFLLNKKSSLYDWCQRSSVPFLEDPSNKDVKFSRNRIRHNILPEVLKINPGIYRVVAKKILSGLELSEHSKYAKKFTV